MLKVIKEYLVSLGYKVDAPSFNQFRGSMTQAERIVTGFANTSVMKYAAAGAAITTFAGVAISALYKFTIGVADAELKNEMFARKMWMSNDAALSFKNSLDALGVTVQDLYLSPELMNKFIELRNQASRMELPGGNFESAMKGIRSITFEFQRFKLEASYATYWVGYYLSKYLVSPLGGVNGGLKGINDWLEKNMPKYTQKIAAFLGNVYKMLSAGVVMLKTGYDYLNRLTPAAKGFLAVFTAGALGLINPITLILAGLAGILLLIDDYNTWKNGGLSAWGDTWDELANNGDLARLAQSTSDLVDNINKLLDIDVGEDGKNTWIGNLVSGTEKLLNLLNDVLTKIQDITDKMKNSTPNDYWDPNGENYSPNMYLKNPFGMGVIQLPIKDIVRSILGYTFKDPVLNWMGIGRSAPQHSEYAKQISYHISPTYNITSTADAVTLARAVDNKNISLITRTQKGVLV